MSARIASLLLLAASATALVLRAGGAADKPLGRPTRAAAQAAERAFGRRVLVINRPDGKPPSASVHESHKAPEGWALYEGAPPGADGLRGALAALAARALETFDENRRKASPEVEAALDLFAVKTVLFQRRPEEAALVVDRPEAEPVLRVGGDVPPDAADPVALARALRAEETPHRDWDDDLFCGGIVVESETPGRFVFPYAAEGALVTVAGAPVATPGRAGPLLLLDLPAGRTRVDVARRERAWSDVVPVAAMAGLMGGLIWFLLTLRPKVEPDDAAPSPPNN
ncbi:MAG: hypothetical protein HMLKMBBP_01194 [Planctomycetes bacterium]|nr:hypothetical protein [Planctomycetota bacterium]